MEHRLILFVTEGKGELKPKCQQLSIEFGVRKIANNDKGKCKIYVCLELIL